MELVLSVATESKYAAFHREAVFIVVYVSSYTDANKRLLMEMLIKWTSP